MKYKSNFLKNGLLLSVLSVIVAILSFTREIVFADYFGVTALADAYTVAIQTPEILAAVVWEALNTIVIPIYTEQRYLKGDKRAAFFTSNILSIVCIGLIVLIILTEIFANEIIFIMSPGFTGEIHELAAILMRCAMPMILFEGITRIYSAILNVYEKFAFPKIISTFRNICIIVFLLLFYEKIGVFSAVYGLVFGVIIECLVCVIYAQKYSRYIPYLNIKEPYLKKAGALVIPILISTGVAEINQFVDKVIASFLDSGSLASLSYALKLSSIIQIIFINNVIILMFPTFSEYAARGEKKELATSFVQTVNTLILVCTPLVFGSFILREEIITVIFARGAFDTAAVPIVGNVFVLYMVCGLFSALRGIGIKLLTVCGDTSSVMINSTIGVAMNIILDIILSKIWGVIGVALASAVSLTITGISLLRISKYKLSAISYRNTCILSVKVLLSSVCMCYAIFFINKIQEFWYGIDSGSLLFLSIALKIILGIVVYFIILLLLKTDEVRKLLSHIKKVRNS